MMPANSTGFFYSSDDGLRLHARDVAGPQANAPVVMCLPGLTRNHRDFGDLADALASTHRVICPDQRGRGKSQWDPDPSRYRPDRYVQDMQQLIAALGISRLQLVGTSLGGFMSMMLAAALPDVVERIVINDIGPVADATGLARIASYVGKVGVVSSWAEAAQSTAALHGHAFPDYTDADWMRMAHEVYSEMNCVPVLAYDPAISQAFMTSTASTNVWPLFDQIAAMPMLVVRGETSDILSAETLAEMQRRAPGLRHVTVPRTGHAPTLSEPVAREAVLAFLRA